MSKLIVMILAVTLASSITGSVCADTTWYKVGDTGFTNLSPAVTRNANLIQFNPVAVDASGNKYVHSGSAENNVNGGGVTIFKTDGTQVNVSLQGQGSITQMVKAGDGNIYALQNWHRSANFHWGYNYGYEQRIIRINDDGSINTIKSFGNSGAFTENKQRPQGIAVGGDGNIYFTQNGVNSKNNYFWKYDVFANTLTDLMPGVNNGWSDIDYHVNLAYTGNGWFSVINSGGGSWGQDAINATTARKVGATSNPGWGRDIATAIAYDPTTGILWSGARGASNRLILSNWSNFNAADGKAGNSAVWHALNSDADLGTNWWVSGLTALNGIAYMGFGAGNNTTDLSGYRGKIIGRDQYLNLLDFGTPQANADIMGLGNDGFGVYALVMDRDTGVYTLYSTVVPEPGSILCLIAGLTGIVGYARRRS